MGDAILSVDLSHQLLDLSFQRFVFGYLTPAGHTNLHKNEAFLVLRVVGQKPIQSAKAFAV